MDKKLASQSFWMTLCRHGGFERVAWALRRIHTPVSRDALVLEVGSGGNPYPRANVLLDAYEATRERHWVPLKVDRPLVMGFVENLPFADKAFDFVIASHVLEHSKDPAKFLSELVRVARAGYIEVPDAFMERINPYVDHRLEISVQENVLVIRKKASWKPEADTVDLYERKAKRWISQETIPKHPFDFHVRYYWSESIPYQIVNPETKADWNEPERTVSSPARTLSASSQLKSALMNLFRWLFSQNRRNRELNLEGLLRCVSCPARSCLKKDSSGTKLECTACSQIYSVRNGIPVLTA